MDNCTQEIDLLFEVSWEVCNKVGGIYTVLSTKAKTLHDQYDDKLVFIGPDVWSEENPSPYFVESRSLLSKILKKTMLPEGVNVRAGRWDIPGKPIALLVSFNGMYASKDEAYGKMWNLYGVDSLHSYGDYDEGCAFGRAAAELIKAFVTAAGVDARNVIAHFDEWTTAMGLLTVKADMPEIATVFTTHATSIGRSICGNGKPLYDYLEAYNGDQMAAELNMQSKHSLEKAAAWNADCFTTVSDVTAREAEVLLERRPIVTPNGFEAGFVPTAHKFAAARRKARKTLLNVASALTGREFDNDTFILATSGRCEYRNKGLDVFLDAINKVSSAELNRPILAYVLVPAWSAGPRPDLQHNVDTNTHSRLGDPVLTHRLNNYNEDPINCRIHQLGITNDANAKVTVIYVPCYLDGFDGIFNQTYYDLLPGLDATVFASYYEPWGYTPLESVAFSVPTTTTTLAGFGLWVLSLENNDIASTGVRVINRTDSNYNETVNEIADAIVADTNAANSVTQKLRTAAKNTAAKAQWADFINYYYHSYCEALKARNARICK